MKILAGEDITASDINPRYSCRHHICFRLTPTGVLDKSRLVLIIKYTLRIAGEIGVVFSNDEALNTVAGADRGPPNIAAACCIYFLRCVRQIK